MTERIAGKRGMLTSYPPRTVGTLRDYLVSPLPTPPASFDYAKLVKGGFPMAMNNSLGCCTISGVIHLLQLAYAVVGKEFVYPGDQDVENTYFNMTGGVDSGLVETDVLNKWHKTGLFGVKALAWAAIDIRDTPMLAAACYAFGGLYLGGDIPQDSETQFENGQWWTLEPGNNPPVGGHCFIGSGSNARGIPDITWGAEDGFTWGWWRYYGTNAYVVIPEIFAEVNHGPLKSIDLATLQADIARI